ncbi:sigma-70 family RNA polymerase sigma factor [Oscillatoria amoena NRMC-F 0135]|nr:sigma-70 family RNA polymerase sigma factor [Oscillatoria amoena NRMC-F 0135]
MGLFNKTYNNFTDEELMGLVGKGVKAAFNELYSRYDKKLHYFMLKILQYDAEKASDFLHDIFVQIIEKPERFDTTKKFSTWVYTLAKNMCLNELRNSANRARLTTDAGKQQETMYNPAYVAKMDASLFVTELNKICTELSDKEQLIITLRFQQELSIKEIAEIMDCPEGTVKSGIYYLLKRIAKKIPHFNPNS